MTMTVYMYTVSVPVTCPFKLVDLAYLAVYEYGCIRDLFLVISIF